MFSLSTDEFIYAVDEYEYTFMHLATAHLSGSEMRRLLTELPADIIIQLLKTRDKENRTPLCQAAVWTKTNVDVIMEMVDYILHHTANPGRCLLSVLSLTLV